jgi:tetratricopeptide (TPR) repeat protein
MPDGVRCACSMSWNARSRRLIRVSRPPRRPAARSPLTKHTILFLAANPLGTDRLALDREARAIHVELKRCGYGDRFAFVTRWAAEPLDLLRELRELKPAVVHFSGYGGSTAATPDPAHSTDVLASVPADQETRGLCFHRPVGGGQTVSPEAIARTFAAAGTQVRLVVLNACFSEPVAEALLAHVDCVVGMSCAMHSDVARSFAIGFYGGLGEHESIAAAFAQGQAAIHLEGLPDADRPQLKLRAGFEPAQLILAAVVPAAIVELPCPRPRVRPNATDDADSLQSGDSALAAGFDDLLEMRYLPLPTRDVSPSMLLAAPFAVVPWHNTGRDNVIATLDAWADDAAQPVAVRLLHAPSGSGKTRLAMEWLQRRRSRGDSAGFLPLVAKDDWLVRACRLGVPVLVVVDYAEARSDLLGVLGTVAAMAATSNPPHIRVLLLARSHGDWWEALVERELALKVLLSAQEPIELRPFAMDAGERQAAFEVALAAFAKHRKRPVPHASICAGDPRFERVLYLHMAALAAVERNVEPTRAAESTDSSIVLEASDLMDEILDHEQRFWLRDRRDRNQAAISLARQIVAAATLRGGIALETEAQQLCQRLAGRERTDADDEVLARLHDVYAVDEGGSYLPGLQPDLLGEAMVLRVATRQTDGQWIERVIPSGDDAKTIGNTFRVLGHAAAVDAAAISPWLTTLLRTELAIRSLPALWAAKAVGQRTAFSPLGDLLADALERYGTSTIALAMTTEPIPLSTVSLRRVAEWRVRVQLAIAPTGRQVTNLANRAALLDEWGVRLIYLGRRETALEAIRKAVEAYRVLVRRYPDLFLSLLASSLNNLGILFAAVGQRDAALAVTRQAVKFRRRLAAKYPHAFLPKLADSLHHLGLRLSNVGRRRAALDATRQAVKFRRALAAKHPDSFLADLADSLDSLGLRWSEIGQREAALDASREAVELYRALAAKHPDAFLPRLANSWQHLGKLLSEVGQREAALDATRTAVELRWALVARDSEAFLPDLASSLDNLGNRLTEVGQHEAALNAIRKAVELHRMLAAKNPDAFLPDLAGSLHNLGVALNEVGQHEAAVDAAHEAVEAVRALAAKNSDAFLPNLTIGLNNLGALLGVVGQREAALEATREAVDLCRVLVAKHPDAFLPDLATSLTNHGRHLSAVGQRDAAIDTTREAVELRRALAAKYPGVFLPGLATSLADLGRWLTHAEDHDAANVASRAAVEIQAALQAKNACPGKRGEARDPLRKAIVADDDSGHQNRRTHREP